MVLASVRKLIASDSQPTYLSSSDARDGGTGTYSLQMADTRRPAEAMEQVVDHEAIRPPYLHVCSPFITTICSCLESNSALIGDAGRGNWRDDG